MADHLDKEKRSWNMSRIQSKDSIAEIKVRSALHNAGYRFRLHKKDMPGKPDIVLPKYKTVIFIHGCFWHRHKGCSKASEPKTNKEYWLSKFQRNVDRDCRTRQQLQDLHWNVIVLWECEIRKFNSNDIVSKILKEIKHGDSKTDEF